MSSEVIILHLVFTLGPWIAWSCFLVGCGSHLAAWALNQSLRGYFHKLCSAIASAYFAGG